MENEEELQKMHLNTAHSWLTHEQLISAPVFEFILDLILVLLTHRNPHASHRKKEQSRACTCSVSHPHYVQYYPFFECIWIHLLMDLCKLSIHHHMSHRFINRDKWHQLECKVCILKPHLFVAAYGEGR